MEFKTVEKVTPLTQSLKQDAVKCFSEGKKNTSIVSQSALNNPTIYQDPSLSHSAGMYCRSCCVCRAASYAA